MNKQKLSIATITLARDVEEEKILTASLKQLARLTIPVFITDGGSTGSFLEFLQSIPHFILSPDRVRGVWAQAKNTLLAACQSDSDFILYTEPDKLTFFKDSLSQILDQLQVDDQSGIILAARSEVGFATFPVFQQMSETTINSCCKEIMGKTFDYTYGPFVLNKKIVPYLTLVEEDIGWGFRPYLFGIAHRLGYRVEACVGDFSCPIEQRKDNASERIYRMRQLSQNIQGLVLSTTIPAEVPSARS